MRFLQNWGTFTCWQAQPPACLPSGASWGLPAPRLPSSPRGSPNPSPLLRKEARAQGCLCLRPSAPPKGNKSKAVSIAESDLRNHPWGHDVHTHPQAGTLPLTGTHTHTHSHLHMYTLTHTCTHIHSHSHIYTQVQNTLPHTHAHTYTRTLICTYTCTHAHTGRHAYSHAHAHTLRYILPFTCALTCAHCHSHTHTATQMHTCALPPLFTQPDTLIPTPVHTYTHPIHTFPHICTHSHTFVHTLPHTCAHTHLHTLTLMLSRMWQGGATAHSLQSADPRVQELPPARLR